MKKKINLLAALVILLLFALSCQNTVKQKENYNIIESDSISNASLLNQIIGKNLITIVKENEEFLLSCAEKSNSVKLNNTDLYLEIVEPINYKIKNIEETNTGFKVVFKEENFYYNVSIIDKNKEIYYWENITKTNNEIDNDYSFYTVEENKLSTLNLKKEKCLDNGILTTDSTWKSTCTDATGKYFIYSVENNEGSLSGELKKDFFFSITGKMQKNEDFYEFLFNENYSSTGESESEQFWDDFSTTEKIAEIKVLNDNEIEFKWFGFTNIRKNQREYTNNPFTINSQSNTIVLKKCDN